MASMSSVVPDHKMNRQISLLVVQCPVEGCSYESQLKIMDDHLRACLKKSVKCPFHDIGCDRSDVALDRNGEPMQMACCQHSENLVEMIGNLKYEVAENNSEIVELKKTEKDRDAKIEAMNAQIESLKGQIESMRVKVFMLLFDVS